MKRLKIKSIVCLFVFAVMFAVFGLTLSIKRAHAEETVLAEANLSLGEEIVLKTSLLNIPSGYTAATMRFTLSGETVEESAAVTEGKASFEYKGITPHNFSSEVSISYTVTGDGMTAIEKTVSKPFTVDGYAAQLLADHPADDALKQLVVDMYAYGEALKTYAERGNTALTNVSDYGLSPTAFTAIADPKIKKVNGTSDKLVWENAYLFFDYKVNLAFSFSGTFTGEPILKIKKDGGEEQVADKLETIETDGKTTYRGIYRAINLSEYNTKVTAIVYDGEEKIEKTADYSLASAVYAFQSQEAGAYKDVVQRTYNYGLTAVAYETYKDFTFEATGENSCKLVKYNGSSSDVVIPDTDFVGRAVKEIGRGVFANKSNIVSVKIPDTVEVLGVRSDSSADTDGVFFNCSALKTIVYNGKLKLVGDQTFNGCSALNVSELWNCMDMIETIGRGSFQKVILPENLVFPASLATLEKWSFQHCKGVKTITFAGNKVKNIGGATFASISSLQSVVIPSSVISVADCLKVCPALKTVTFERSKVVHGSITAGNPFVGTYPSDFVINVPDDSYDDYCVSLGAFASYVAKPPAQTFTLTIEGATINGERTLSLESGAKLPADATVVYDDDAAFLGWAKNTAYYGDYSALCTEFEMGYEDVTLRALYPKDFTKHFIPSCRLGGKDGKPVNQQQHGTIGSLPTTRVTGTAGHSKHIVFPNGHNMLHSSDQKYCLCPVSSKYKTCLLLTFTNHTDADITFKYMAEFDKKYIGEVIVTVPANSQKTALLVVNKAPQDRAAAYHELMITSGADNGYDLTIYGKYL